MKALLAPLLAAVLLLASACTPAQIGGEMGGECRSDRDCLYGLVCSLPAEGKARQCVLETYGPCTRDRDCLWGRRCLKSEGEDSGMCVTQCIDNEDCKDPERPFCVVGVCERAEK